ncbi:transcriptional regulator [Latilactobacillus sakei]|uniref:ArpU family phage packaging/lysis transcriptional regulator n=1 Tax=Latilactobacillus TaxID=2767885 RepID=UPI00077C83C5|nr:MULTISPECIES: ArpU family phage packaging/lysis transcriptional regulator [Latilactobacillus]ARJ72625.1 transcriptional regulator [Latilactobacillus sakei]MDB1552502.1 transcriptional regulator [Latilactobacillus sakei]MDM5044604.1 ArpU family phage packaging/lysis transcriptional regulator [Latilactobacillus sakei]USG07603.1 transcriptional regulator [Latilactobacillus sakei]USG11281.1 transcriptional regulator [Latilactobacillus sakei]
MSKLFDFDIDEDKSRQQADELLTQYWRLKHVVISTSSLRSPSYSHTPKSFSGGNATEKRAVKTLEARQTLEYIDVALSKLTVINRELLKMQYLSAGKLTMAYICGELGITASSFKKHKKQALLEFAESYPSEGLLIFKEH